MNTFIKLRHYLCFLPALLLFSCTPKSDFYSADYYAFKETESDKWGLVAPNGKILVKDEFKEQPVGIYNGIFFVPTSNGISMFSASNPTVPVGDEYKDICPFFSDITTSVKDNEVIKVIDKKGTVRFELPVNYTKASAFYFGYSVVYNKTTHKNEALSSSGKFIKSEKYSIIKPLPGDKFLAEDPESYDIFLLNRDMEKITRFCKSDDFDYITPDLKYYAYRDENGNHGLKNINGESVIRPKYDSKVLYVNESCIIIRDNDDQYGVINSRGENIIRPKYDEFNCVKDDCIAVYDDEKDRWGMINNKGDVLLPFEYSAISAIPNTKYFVVEPYGNSYCFFVDKNGNRVDKMEYRYFGIGNDGLGNLNTLIYMLDEPTTLESDYLDLNGIVGAILNPKNIPLSLFRELYGHNPSSIYNSRNLSFGPKDVERADGFGYEYFPTRSFSLKECDEYGDLSYNLGFDEINICTETGYYLSTEGECCEVWIKFVFDNLSEGNRTKIRDGLDSALEANHYRVTDGYGTDAIYYTNGSFVLHYYYYEDNDMLSFHVFNAGS